MPGKDRICTISPGRFFSGEYSDDSVSLQPPEGHRCPFFPLRQCLLRDSAFHIGTQMRTAVTAAVVFHVDRPDTAPRRIISAAAGHIVSSLVSGYPHAVCRSSPRAASFLSSADIESPPVIPGFSFYFQYYRKCGFLFTAHEQRVFACFRVITVAPSYHGKAVILIQCDGLPVGLPDFQKLDFYTFFLCRFQQQIHHPVSYASGAVKGMNRHPVDFSFIQYTGDARKADQLSPAVFRCDINRIFRSVQLSVESCSAPRRAEAERVQSSSGLCIPRGRPPVGDGLVRRRQFENRLFPDFLFFCFFCPLLLPLALRFRFAQIDRSDLFAGCRLPRPDHA